MAFFEQLHLATADEREVLLAAPLIQQALSGSITLNDYVAFLEQAYHHVKHTVPLLMATGARLPEHKEWLRVAIAEYIKEEIGHHEWILSDIAVCGFDKEFVRNRTASLHTELMVSYAYDTVSRISPLGIFGMIQVLEGTSISVAVQAAHRIRDTLSLPEQACSYLYSHGYLDIEHMQFFKNLMNRIEDQQEQNQIIHSAKVFYKLYSDIFRSLNPDHGIPRTAL